MKNTIKFGKRIPLPTTVQIKHELRLLAAADDLVAAGLWDVPLSQPTDAALSAVAKDLARTHGITLDRAEMLVAHFGSNEHTLRNAADALQTRGEVSPAGTG